MLIATTKEESAFKTVLVAEFSKLCAKVDADDELPLPFGHALFRDVKNAEDLRSLWFQQIKFLVKRPGLPPHPYAADIEEFLFDVIKKSAPAVAASIEVGGALSEAPAAELEDAKATGPSEIPAGAAQASST
jgi:hypothetical protein